MEILNFSWHHFCISKIDRTYLKLKRLLFHLGKDKYPRKCWAIKTILRYKLHPELIILIHCQKHLPSLFAYSSRNSSCCWNLPWRLLGSPWGKALHWRPILINNNSNFIVWDIFLQWCKNLALTFILVAPRVSWQKSSYIYCNYSPMKANPCVLCFCINGRLHIPCSHSLVHKVLTARHKVLTVRHYP